MRALLAVPGDEGLDHVGNVASGFSDRELDALTVTCGRLEHASSPLTHGSEAAVVGARWVWPTLIGEVEFTGRTASGRLRHPSVSREFNARITDCANKDSSSHINVRLLILNPSASHNLALWAHTRRRTETPITSMTTPGLKASSRAAGSSMLHVRQTAVGLALAVTAAIHVLDLPGKVEEAPYLAVAYVFLIVASIVIIERIFRGGIFIDYLAAMGLSIAILLAFVVNRTVGMPGATGDIGNWLEPLGLLSLVVEGFVVWQAAAAIALLRRER